MNKLITTFWLPGRGVGKARPRLGRQGVYMPDRYTQWKRKAIASVDWSRLAIAPQPCFVECLLVNFLSSDSDNLTGSVLDAMVEATYLKGDSSSFVSGSLGKFVKTQKIRGADKPIGILVNVYQAEVPTIDLSKYLPSNNLVSWLQRDRLFSPAAIPERSKNVRGRSID